MITRSGASGFVRARHDFLRSVFPYRAENVRCLLTLHTYLRLSVNPTKNKKAFVRAICLNNTTTKRCSSTTSWWTVSASTSCSTSSGPSTSPCSRPSPSSWPTPSSACKTRLATRIASSVSRSARRGRIIKRTKKRKQDFSSHTVTSVVCWVRFPLPHLDFVCLSLVRVLFDLVVRELALLVFGHQWHQRCTKRAVKDVPLCIR